MTSAAFAHDFKEGIQQDEIAQAWLARGYSCDIWIEPPNQEREHDTQQDKVMMLVSGMIEIHFADRSVRPEIGEEIKIPAGTHYTLSIRGRTTACWLYGQRLSPSEL